MKKIIIMILFLFILSGCTQKNESLENFNPLNISKNFISCLIDDDCFFARVGCSVCCAPYDVGDRTYNNVLNKKGIVANNLWKEKNCKGPKLACECVPQIKSLIEYRAKCVAGFCTAQKIINCEIYCEMRTDKQNFSHLKDLMRDLNVSSEECEKCQC